MTRALSELEYAAETGGGPAPAAARAGDDVWVLPQPMPNEYSPHYSLGYLIRDARGGLHLVDPGLDSDGNRERLSALVTEIRGDSGAPGDSWATPELASITVTHLHRDHLGMAERLRRETGVPVALHREEQASLARLLEAAPRHAEIQAARAEAWGVPADRMPELAAAADRAASGGAESDFRADVLLDDGELLAIPGRRIRALHTPGHTPGHLCLHDLDRGILFTGDHLLPSIYPGIGLGGPAADPIGDYLRSLDRVAALDAQAAASGPAAPSDPGSGALVTEVFPGHGYRFTGLAERAEVTRRHHLTRSAEVAAVLAGQADATVWQIAERIRWTAGWPNMRGFYLASALAQTQMHVAHLSAA
ncbi:MBL fold metallo-hydrolase [Herbiconiux ginsengi]|uniref:Glyoxylase, beta-lactamase superfamily II n=1 Tax=Herbiconiux ginsengi TaxID=381665 RepID=A0A1H3MCQ4_9MICO|nr:MBL fold metallo-hydrolase [Herbiconiux ginsengi]SDY73969.1 Glyoxylase, beta-lactamase superfamily II [Herbiconiux ginsengi]